MEIDFSAYKGVAILQGNVKKITRVSDGAVLWKKAEFVWEKYSVTEQTVYAETYTGNVAKTESSYDIYWYASNRYNLNTETGNFVLVNAVKYLQNDYISSDTLYTTRPYVIMANKTKDTKIYKALSKSGSNITFGGYSSAIVTENVRGEYISDVTASTADAYPVDGVHTDGYWYVYKGEA